MAQEIDLKSIEGNFNEGSNPSPPTILKLLGPYLRKDKRKHAILYWSDGRQQTISWPRVLLMQAGYKLTDADTVDHIDGDFTNDSLKNLQVLSLAENVRKSIIPGEVMEFTCPWCGKLSSRRANKVRHNRKQAKSGPYCSRSCGGKASHPSNRK